MDPLSIILSMENTPNPEIFGRLHEHVASKRQNEGLHTHTLNPVNGERSL